jgi:hypothetical protein
MYLAGISQSHFSAKKQFNKYFVKTLHLSMYVILLYSATGLLLAMGYFSMCDIWPSLASPPGGEALWERQVVMGNIDMSFCRTGFSFCAMLYITHNNKTPLCNNLYEQFAFSLYLATCCNGALGFPRAW